MHRWLLGVFAVGLALAPACQPVGTGTTASGDAGASDAAGNSQVRMRVRLDGELTVDDHTETLNADAYSPFESGSVATPKFDVLGHSFSLVVQGGLLKERLARREITIERDDPKSPIGATPFATSSGESRPFQSFGGDFTTYDGTYTIGSVGIRWQGAAFAGNITIDPVAGPGGAGSAGGDGATPSGPAGPALTQVSVEMVSVSTDGQVGNMGGDTWNHVRPRLSDDGRYVAFHSMATNLVPNPPKPPNFTGGSECYLRDRTNKTTTRVSRQPNGDPLWVQACWIDQKGTKVLFIGYLGPYASGSSSSGLYIYDIAAGSVRKTYTLAITSGGTPKLSPDGNWLVVVDCAPCNGTKFLSRVNTETGASEKLVAATFAGNDSGAPTLVSNDGHVFYSVTTPGASGMRLLRRGSSAAEVVEAAITNYEKDAWFSSDGRSIAYQRPRDTKQSIGIYSLDTRTVTKIDTSKRLSTRYHKDEFSVFNVNDAVNPYNGRFVMEDGHTGAMLPLVRDASLDRTGFFAPLWLRITPGGKHLLVEYAGKNLLTSDKLPDEKSYQIYLITTSLPGGSD